MSSSRESYNQASKKSTSSMQPSRATVRQSRSSQQPVDGRGAASRSRVDTSRSSGTKSSSVSTTIENKGTGLKNTSVSKLEDEIIELRRENAKLKKGLSEIKSLHEQLLHEAAQENFGQKRVNLLKSQVFQLERQVLVLSQALGNRAETLFDLQMMLDSMMDKMRNCSCPIKGEVVEKAKTMKGRLSKCSKSSSMEELSQPLLFMDTFIRPDRRIGGEGSPGGGSVESGVSIIDICSGKTNHLNLKQVGCLESKLAGLYKTLTQLQCSLKASPSQSTVVPLFRPMEERLISHVTESRKLIGDCCHDLLCLSLLIPTVPWPALKDTKVIPAITTTNVMKKMPSSIRGKKEAKEAIEAATNTFCCLHDMTQLKCKALEEELLFHQTVYNLQNSYVGSLFEAVRSGYENFEQSIIELVCSPLQAILEKYTELSQTASDSALKEFLQLFQDHHSQLKNTVSDLQKPNTSSLQKPQGVEALSLFGQQFFARLKELEDECSKRRRQESLLAQNHP